jgi:hypothetical protein
MLLSPELVGRVVLLLAISVAALPALAQVPPPPGAMKPTTQPIVTSPPPTQGPPGTGTETIVFLRHGEKPPGGLGQLTPQGLNRAIALSTVLPAKFGRPDFLFAPDPSLTKVTEHGSAYYYIRPLTTIEPTAIALGMPVQTPFGFSEINKLNAELTLPKYAQSTIFVAWEHGYEQKAVVDLVKQFGGDANKVPKWPGSDYDSLYVIRLTRVPGRQTALTFAHEQEGLDGLSKAMPTAAAGGDAAGQAGGR